MTEHDRRWLDLYWILLLITTMTAAYFIGREMRPAQQQPSLTVPSK